MYRRLTPWISQISSHSKSSSIFVNKGYPWNVQSFSTVKPILEYSGPLSKMVRTMKAVSITSCTLTMVGMPTVLLIGSNSVPVVGQLAICGTVMAFGVGTTGLFHYLFKPYVRNLIVEDPNSENPKFLAETFSLTAGIKNSQFELKDVTPLTNTMHPLASFSAKGNTYFVHADSFQNKSLLEKMLGRPLTEAEQLIR